MKTLRGQKLDQRGFGAVEILLALVAVAAVGFIAYYAISSSGESDNSANQTENETSLNDTDENAQDAGDVPDELQPYIAAYTLPDGWSQYRCDDADFYQLWYVQTDGELPSADLECDASIVKTAITINVEKSDTPEQVCGSDHETCKEITVDGNVGTYDEHTNSTDKSLEYRFKTTDDSYVIVSYTTPLNAKDGYFPEQFKEFVESFKFVDAE